MSEPDRPEDREHPVLAGLVALVAVGLVVGLLVGGITLIATRVLGLGGSSDGTTSTSNESLYLPPFTALDSPSGPLLTLVPTHQTDRPSGSATASSSPTGGAAESDSTAPGDGKITLQSGQSEVSDFDQIDLTGVYPGGEGAILQVQRFQGGTWVDFPVTASVSNETFATYVQTSQQGLNRFRMIDTDSGATSNEVRVTVN